MLHSELQIACADEGKIAMLLATNIRVRKGSPNWYEFRIAIRIKDGKPEWQVLGFKENPSVDKDVKLLQREGEVWLLENE